MLLQELTLHDFRTYGGRQSIQLAPKKGRPIVLVGGLNGAGKTTLLDALQLVLYGQRAQCASRGDLAYKTYLRQAIHRRADPSAGASIELHFTHASEGATHDYRVRRNWRATPSGIRERMEIEVNGVVDELLTEQWDERVDDFAPHRISHLFFFDGEKIAELAEAESSAAVLKTAVHSLLGLDLVDRLDKDLAILSSKKRREGRISFDRTRLEQLSSTRERLEEEHKAANEKRAEINTQLDAADGALKKITRKYQAEGGELAEQRSTLEGERKSLLLNQEERRGRLREITLGSLPLAAIGDLLKEIDQTAHQEEETQRHALLSDVLKKRDVSILKKLKKDGTSKDVLTRLKGLLAEDRDTRNTAMAESGYLDFAPEELRQLDRLVNAELPAQVAAARALAGDLDDIHERIVSLDRKLRSIPEEGDLATLRENRSDAQAMVEKLKTLLGVQDERIETLNSQLESAIESHKRELDKELKAAQGDESLYRVLDRVGVASDVLGEFRAKVLKQNLGRVEGAILESFQSLIRKPNLVKQLEIDPVDFALELTGGDGTQLRHEHMSAGEKQLLAISMLWGLARTAGLPLPVVIDTPLGRLDSKHRTHLVERYFPHASHQVLLLSTDEEIKDNRLTELQPFVGRSYRLEHNEEEDRTLISEGYFDN